MDTRYVREQLMRAQDALMKKHVRIALDAVTRAIDGLDHVDNHPRQHEAYGEAGVAPKEWHQDFLMVPIAKQKAPSTAAEHPEPSEEDPDEEDD